MGLKLYGVIGSPAVRATLLVLKAIGMEFEFVEVNILKGEQMTPEYLELNPLHTVPTLKDDDFVIWDSHAINAYLIQKYGKDDSFYPKDLQKRATVDQRLYFDVGVMFPSFGWVIVPVLRSGAKTIDKKNSERIYQAYGQLETLLERSGPYVAGDSLTIADFSIVTTVTTANVLVPIAANRFPKITEWISRMQKLPYYKEANQEGLDKFVEIIKSKLA